MDDGQELRVAVAYDAKNELGALFAQAKLVGQGDVMRGMRLMLATDDLRVPSELASTWRRAQTVDAVTGAMLDDLRKQYAGQFPALFG